MKKIYSYSLVVIIFSIFFIFTSCELSPSITYPSWFNNYSSEALANLKSAQDAFNCFGDTIGSNLTNYPDDTFYYSEDSSAKTFMSTFTTKNGGALIESTDIQPFRDAALANGYVQGADINTYTKGNITIDIYVIAWSGDDPHFEVFVTEDLT